LKAFEDPAFEPGLLAYRPDLIELNNLVLRLFGPRIEGNLFYPDVMNPMDAPNPAFLAKRRNFARFALAGTRMLEIGVNAGHSAMLALTMNPNLHYTGVDGAGHPYSRGAIEWLEQKFPERCKILIGDSRVVLPRLIEQRADFDLFHVDGGHDFDCAYKDMVNTIALARGGSLILLDDTNYPMLESLCDHLVLAGKVSRETMGRSWDAMGQHALLRTPRH
jgi:hypothetical protein